MLPKEYGSGSTCHRRFQEWNGIDVFKNAWIKLLRVYDEKIGNNRTWQSIDSISIKSPLGGTRLEIISLQIGANWAQKYILTEKKGIPLLVVISSASTHDINLITDVVDNTVIKRAKSSSKSKSESKRRRRLLQHLYLDEGYKSKEEEEEQKLIRRDYVLHIPIKKKSKVKKG